MPRNPAHPRARREERPPAREERARRAKGQRESEHDVYVIMMSLYVVHRTVSVSFL